MKRILILSLVLFMVFFPQYYSFADKSHPQEGMDYIYKSCRESVNTAKFNESYCRTAIVSFFVGASLMIQSSPFFDAEPTCNAKIANVVETFQKRICGTPDKDFEKVAIEYVSWYENSLKSSEGVKTLNKRAPELSLGLAIVEIYSCD